MAKISELASLLGVSEASLVDLDDVAQNIEEMALLRNYRAASERDRRLAREQVQPREDES